MTLQRAPTGADSCHATPVFQDLFPKCCWSGPDPETCSQPRHNPRQVSGLWKLLQDITVGSAAWFASFYPKQAPVRVCFSSSDTTYLCHVHHLDGRQLSRLRVATLQENITTCHFWKAFQEQVQVHQINAEYLDMVRLCCFLGRCIFRLLSLELKRPD